MPAHAVTFTVTAFSDSNSGGAAGTGAGSSGDLRYAILAANATGGAGNTIQFSCSNAPCTITLNGPLPPITSNLTIDGGTFGNILIDGASLYRVFFVDTGMVTLENLQIQNASATGGAGGNGVEEAGGGGAGLGAGLFVNQASAVVTVANDFFLNCSATGGAGGNGIPEAEAGGGGGGGGGLAFSGGAGAAAAGANTGAGGGGGGLLAVGVDAAGTAGGNGGNGGGGGGGVITGSDVGGSSYAANSGGGSGNTGNGGVGGFGGGGGGGSNGQFGDFGGFGGGGGGNGSQAAAGGSGGPGGGGGAGGVGGPGGQLTAALSGGTGGGSPSTLLAAGGGGGAAAGPAIFVAFGSLTTANSGASGTQATGGGAGASTSGATPAQSGGADATPVFNYQGTVNSSTTPGPIAGALTGPANFTLVVTSTANGGGGSLRAALASAAALGGGTVIFDGTVFTSSNTAAQNTITLSSGLTLPANTIIRGLTSGSGAALTNLVTIDGGGSANNFPIFSVSDAVTGAALANLTITDGNVVSQGGAIENNGSLTVANCTFSDNYAGGYISGAGNGGGAIHSSGTLTIVGSTFSGNRSAPGGAIALTSGTATVLNSTFSGNVALSTYGGGAFFINDGAAITVSNSTFSGNSAGGGGAITDYGTLTMTNSIVANNSGDGIYSGGTLIVANSLIAANSGGNCIVGSGSCPTNGTNGNVVGASSAVLAPLGNYGGPTQTLIPLPASPAICLGTTAAPPAIDQRGAARTTSYSGTTCVDAGAVQTHYALSFAAPGTQPPASVAVSTTMTAPIAALLENGVPFAYASIANATPALTLGTVTINDADSALAAGATTSQALNTASGLAAFGNLSFGSTQASDTLTATLPVGPSLTISATSNSFAILKGSAVVTLTHLNATYSGLPIPVTVTTQPAGLSTNVTYTDAQNHTSASPPTQAGSYAVTAAVNDPNYSGTASATLVIAPALLTITADNQTRAYGAADPTFTWTPSGFVNGETISVLGGAPALSSTDTPTSAVGTTYPITPALGTLAAANYTFTFVDGTLTISGKANQAALSASATPSTIFDGGSSTLSSSGGSGSGAVTFQLTNGPCGIAGNTLTASGVGVCTITAAKAGDTNYNATTSAPITVTVNKDTTTMTLSATPNPASTGQTVTLTATVYGDPPSGIVSFYDGTTTLGSGTLTALNTTSSVATFSISTLTPGTHSLSATYTGDINNQASASVALAVAVNAPPVAAPMLDRWALLGLGGLMAACVGWRLRRAERSLQRREATY